MIVTTGLKVYSGLQVFPGLPSTPNLTPPDDDVDPVVFNVLFDGVNDLNDGVNDLGRNS